MLTWSFQQDPAVSLLLIWLVVFINRCFSSSGHQSRFWLHRWQANDSTHKAVSHIYSANFGLSNSHTCMIPSGNRCRKSNSLLVLWWTPFGNENRGNAPTLLFTNYRSHWASIVPKLCPVVSDNLGNIRHVLWVYLYSISWRENLERLGSNLCFPNHDKSSTQEVRLISWKNSPHDVIA